MKFGKTLANPLKALLLVCFMLLGSACADTSEENFYDSEEKIQWRTDLYHALDYAKTDEEKFVLMAPEELKAADFSGCSVDVLDEYGLRIYERLTEKQTGEFVEMLVQADISGEETDVEWPKGFGGGVNLQFQLIFNNGDMLNIGAKWLDTDTAYFIINGEHEYLCDEETANKMRDYRIEAYRRFDDYVKASFAEG